MLHNSLKNTGVKAKKGRAGDDDEWVERVTDELQGKMVDAIEADWEANRSKKPALKRLMIQNEVFGQLKKIPVQNRFLEKQGCSVLANWLSRMPDGSYPNTGLVKGMLRCIDNLAINQDYLEGTDLGKVIRLYSEGYAEMPEIQ